MENLNFYILTGGPGSGKSTVLKLLSDMGYLTVEEAGRNIIQKQVFENLNVLNVLFGKGISSFEATYGTYPHNIVLNLFVDYGLIGVAFFSYIIVLTIKILKRKDQNEKMIIILLFSSAIVPLLFSFTYWRYPAFFLYIGIVLSKRKQIKYKR